MGLADFDLGTVGLSIGYCPYPVTVVSGLGFREISIFGFRDLGFRVHGFRAQVLHAYLKLSTWPLTYAVARGTTQVILVKAC